VSIFRKDEVPGPADNLHRSGGYSSVGLERSTDNAEVVGSIPTSPTMKAIRRVLVTFGIVGAIASIVRLRGSGGVPPQDGGWRELSGPDLR
jgi:hypothetical protein